MKRRTLHPLETIGYPSTPDTETTVRSRAGHRVIRLGTW